MSRLGPTVTSNVRPDPLDEVPTVTFAAYDRVLPQLLSVYGQICKHAGSPESHLALIAEARDEIIAWQNENPDRLIVAGQQ